MQLWETGKPVPSAISGIQAPMQGGSVKAALDAFLRIADTAFDGVKCMLQEIGDHTLQYDLMSIDPKQTEDVFREKQWGVLGKVPLRGGDVKWQDVRQAIRIAAVNREDAPEYVAQCFVPRLAISVLLPNGGCDARSLAEEVHIAYVVRVPAG